MNLKFSSQRRHLSQTKNYILALDGCSQRCVHCSLEGESLAARASYTSQWVSWAGVCCKDLCVKHMFIFIVVWILISRRGNSVQSVLQLKLIGNNRDVWLNRSRMDFSGRVQGVGLISCSFGMQEFKFSSYSFLDYSLKNCFIFPTLITLRRKKLLQCTFV